MVRLRGARRRAMARLRGARRRAMVRLRGARRRAKVRLRGARRLAMARLRGARRRARARRDAWARPAALGQDMLRPVHLRALGARGCQQTDGNAFKVIRQRRLGGRRDCTGWRAFGVCGLLQHVSKASCKHAHARAQLHSRTHTRMQHESLTGRQEEGLGRCCPCRRRCGCSRSRAAAGDIQKEGTALCHCQRGRHLQCRRYGQAQNLCTRVFVCMCAVVCVCACVRACKWVWVWVWVCASKCAPIRCGCEGALVGVR